MPTFSRLFISVYVLRLSMECYKNVIIPFKEVLFMKQETIDRIRKFSDDRDWDQFHSPANLAKSISIEANELLECFQWDETNFDINAVKEELADVMVYCRNMLDKLGLDEDEIINEKMAKNEAKYPIEKAKGKADKYNKL